MSKQRSTVQGIKARALPSASRTFGKGRICAAAGCSTVLSQYNRREKCWAHADMKVPRLRGRKPRPAQG
ncbi:MAG: hypothetical protein ABR529_14545 [Actinomycetota bacterium]